MKNIVMVLLFSSAFIYHIHALEESSMTFGLSYKNRFAITGDAIHSPGDSKGMIGLNMNAFGFWNGSSIGIFVMYNALAAVYVTDLKEASNIYSYGSVLQEGSIGVGFRHTITNRLTLLGGLGVDFVMDSINREFYDETEHSTTMLDFGFLGEGGLKFDITDVVCITLGVYASYTFATYTTDPSEWLLKSSVGINPFIGIGFNRYNYQHWGKP